LGGRTYDSTGIVLSADVRLIATRAMVTDIAGSGQAVADVNATLEDGVLEVHGPSDDGQGYEGSEKACDFDELHGDGVFLVCSGFELGK
jgi:hypothetical protein